MIVYCSQDRLLKFLQAELKAWEKIGGGPNLEAFEFNPKNTDPKTLHELGYYENVDSWVAGARIKALVEFIEVVKQLPEATKK